MAATTDYIADMFDRCKKTKSLELHQGLLSDCCTFIEDWASETIRARVPLDEVVLDIDVIKTLLDETIDEVTPTVDEMKQEDKSSWLESKDAAGLSLHLAAGLIARDKVVSSCIFATSKLKGGKLNAVPADVTPHLTAKKYMTHLNQDGDIYGQIDVYFPAYEVHCGSAKQAFFGGKANEQLRSNTFAQMATNCAARIIRECVDPKFGPQIVQIAKEKEGIKLVNSKPQQSQKKRPNKKRRPKPKSGQDGAVMTKLHPLRT